MEGHKCHKINEIFLSNNLLSIIFIDFKRNEEADLNLHYD